MDEGGGRSGRGRERGGVLGGEEGGRAGGGAGVVAVLWLGGREGWGVDNRVGLWRLMVERVGLEVGGLAMGRGGRGVRVVRGVGVWGGGGGGGSPNRHNRPGKISPGPPIRAKRASVSLPGREGI